MNDIKQSRVARKPIALPKGIEVKLHDNVIQLKGNKGSLTHTIPADVEVEHAANEITVKAVKPGIAVNAKAGTTRAIINNLIKGVSEGYEIKLILVGVGYRAQVKGKFLGLTLGFSHPVDFPIPEGITIETPIQTEIVVKGIDKHLVGQVAANIRRYRQPEPYKGKGIRYSTEKVVIKETKKK